MPEIINGIRQAPWETFQGHKLRAECEEPYNQEFIKTCREKALKYNAIPDIWLLSEIMLCIPFHYRSKVLVGTMDVEYYLKERRR